MSKCYIYGHRCIIPKNENAKIGGWNWKFLDEKIVRFV